MNNFQASIESALVKAEQKIISPKGYTIAKDYSVVTESRIKQDDIRSALKDVASVAISNRWKIIQEIDAHIKKKEVFFNYFKSAPWHIKIRNILEMNRLKKQIEDLIFLKQKIEQL